METITTAVQSRTPDATRLIQTLYVELDGGGILPPVRLVQYDQRLPVLALRLLHGGKTYALPSGAAANIRVGKNDGHCVYNPAWGVNADRTEVYVEITAQMTACAGIQMASLEIIANGDVKGTPPLKLDVARNPVQADAYESGDEYKSIYELGQQVAEAGERAKVVQDNLSAIQNIDANMAAIKTAAGSDVAIKTAADNVAAIKTAATDINAIKAAPAQAEAAGKSAQAAAASATAAADSAKAADESAKAAQQVSQGAVGYYATASALNAAHPTAKDGNWAIVGTTDTIWVWDSDTEAWKDTGAETQLSNYYTKDEIEAMRTKILTVTVPSAGWVSGDYTVSWDDGGTSSYNTCATVTVAGVTADSRIVVSDRTRVTDAVRMVTALEPGAGVVKFYADSAPTSAAVFVLEVGQ